MGEVQLKLVWGRKPRRKAARKRPRPTPTVGGIREPGHWSYAFVPPTEAEWEAIVGNAECLTELRTERKGGGDR